MNANAGNKSPTRKRKKRPQTADEIALLSGGAAAYRSPVKAKQATSPRKSYTSPRGNTQGYPTVTVKMQHPCVGTKNQFQQPGTEAIARHHVTAFSDVVTEHVSATLALQGSAAKITAEMEVGGWYILHGCKLEKTAGNSYFVKLQTKIGFRLEKVLEDKSLALTTELNGLDPPFPLPTIETVHTFLFHVFLVLTNYACRRCLGNNLLCWCSSYLLNRLNRHDTLESTTLTSRMPPLGRLRVITSVEGILGSFPGKSTSIICS